MFTAANVSKICFPQKKVDTCLGLPLHVSTNMSTLYRRFPGECIATFFGTIDPKTANMSQFLQLGPLDFDPDLGYVRYFWGIDSANNHSHISKPHPLNNTDTLGGHFPWTVIQPLVNATNFWNAPPIFLPTHEYHLWCALPEGVGTPFFSTVLLSMQSLIWALLGSGNKDAGASGAAVFWQFPRVPRGGDNFSTNMSILDFQLTCLKYIGHLS